MRQSSDNKHFCRNCNCSNASLMFNAAMIIILLIRNVELYQLTLLPTLLNDTPAQNMTSTNTDSEASTASMAITTKKSPWVSYPLATNTTTQCESWRSTTRYAPRFFLGGGKAGSTALWQMLMTGTPWSGYGPNSSDFIGLAQEYSNRPHGRGTGKEMCFGRSSSQTLQIWNSFFEQSSNVSNVGLDCCPRHTERRRVCHLWKLFPCEIKFVMPVRDPYDRALSWFNDKGTSGNQNPIMVDKKLPGLAQKNPLFQYDTILTGALECGVDPRAILVVDTDGLKVSSEEAQRTMDAIDEHYGLPRMRHTVKISNSANAGGKRHIQAKPKPETIALVRETMKHVTSNFLEMLETPDGILQTSLVK